MRSFIRFNGTEASMDNVRIVEAPFNEMVIAELHKVFGEKAQFSITPAKNFVNEDHTDNIFSGIIMGQFESEAPIEIKVFMDIKPMEEFNSFEELPEADLVIPGFLGFRK